MALFETVLPWAFAALRKWWREQARVSNRTVAVSATGVVKVEPLASATVPAASSLRGAVTVEPLAVSPGEAAAKRSLEVCAGRGDRDGTDLSAPGRGDRDGTEARRLWDEARGMTHCFMLDWEKDREYLAKVYGAARLGHLEAMVKLGDYAYRRGAVVEAFYWTLLAELKGATGLGVALREMRSRWLSEGCPEEYENAYKDFTEEQGVFARAVLRLQSGVNPQYARARLKELADRGVEEARLFLGKDL